MIQNNDPTPIPHRPLILPMTCQCKSVVCRNCSVCEGDIFERRSSHNVCVRRRSVLGTRQLRTAPRTRSCVQSASRTQHRRASYTCSTRLFEELLRAGRIHHCPTLRFSCPDLFKCHLIRPPVSLVQLSRTLALFVHHAGRHGFQFLATRVDLVYCLSIVGELSSC